MAGFCTKCGAALSAGTQFCTACGTPLGVTAAPPQPVAAAVPVSTAGSNNVVKVVLVIVLVFVGLGVLATMTITYGIWRMGRVVHVNKAGDVTLSTPTGTITTGTAVAPSAADLGIEIYPGATRHEGGLQVSTSKGSSVTAVYSTSDSLDKVVEFYKGKLGQNASVLQSENGAILSRASQDNKTGLVITVSTADSATDGKTKIAIMRTTGD